MIPLSDPLAPLKAAISARQRKQHAEKKETVCHVMPCGADGTESEPRVTAPVHTLCTASKAKGGGLPGSFFP